jgi:hypothetical protein
MDFDLPSAVSRQAATALPALQPLREVMCFALSRQAWTASAATIVPSGSRGPEISLLGRLIRRTTRPSVTFFTQTARADCFTPANDATQFGLSQTTLFGSDLLRNWQLLESRYPDFVAGYWGRTDLCAPSTSWKEYPARGAVAISGVSSGPVRALHSAAYDTPLVPLRAAGILAESCCFGTMPRSLVLKGPHEHRPAPR